MNRVFILGAGASYHAGAPLGNGILYHYIQNRLDWLKKQKKLFSDVEHSELAPILGNFKILYNILLTQPNCEFTGLTPLKDLLDKDLPNFEDVLTLYDIASEREEPLIYEGSIDTNLYRDDILYVLTKTILDSVEEKKNENNTTSTYEKFVEKLYENDTIISFNYDTLIDNAIKHKFQGLNYGFKFLTGDDIHKSSYPDSDGIHPKAKLRDALEFGFNPKEYEIQLGNNAPLLIKPHGSFNWVYCPKCYRYYYMWHDRMIEEGYNYNECVNFCGRKLQRFIIPMTHHKSFLNPLLTAMWMHVVQQLSKADIVYLIGYSLPDGDLFSKYYLIKGLTRPDRRICAKIKLVDPNAIEYGLDKKYRSIFGDISVIIDKSEFEEVEMTLGEKSFKVPQLKEEKHGYGEKKLEIIPKTFEEWIDDL